MNPHELYLNRYEQVKYLEEAKKRKELSFLYNITKIVARSDSIGEGWHYSPSYNEEDFKDEVKKIKNGERQGYGFASGSYVVNVALPIYKLYLERCGIGRVDQFQHNV